MSETKLFKDPLYGYINIPDYYVSEIIDTATFQRLRRIVQTSYSPLYPSATHNRFEHSFGVYYLGEIAGNSLTLAIQNNDKIKDLTDWSRIKDVFLLSCLLHDVGHAPFSHTGEQFFLDNTVARNQYADLHKTLISLVEHEKFKDDVPNEDSQSAPPHELMSAIVGLQNFSNHLRNSFEKNLFARCITGYKFSETDKIHRLYNCYISLLNSKIIDVDRLDYLIRDAYFTGFDTVNIDYERLLNHITIIEDADDDECYELGYYKGAISVIENFVYAHDSERKWIQNHPCILYDIYIIQHIISNLDKELSSDENRLFSYDCLSESGKELNGNVKISLLCDDDIISLMKRYCKDALSNEYFSRKNRRCPLWKTEAEYNTFVLGMVGSGDPLTKLENALTETELYLRTNTDEWIVNDSTISRLEKEIEHLKANSTTKIGAEAAKTLNAQKKTKEQVLKVMKCLQAYSSSKGEICDFVILTARQFYSGFNKPDFSDIKIVFPAKDGKRKIAFEKAVTALSGRENLRDDFFYIFFKRSAKEKYDKEELCKSLFIAFLEKDS